MKTKQATVEYHKFYHTNITKQEFEDKLEDIMLCYNEKMLPDSYKVAAVLAYCRNKFITKPPIKPKNKLAWVRLATTKKSDPKYDLSSIKYNGTWSWATDGARCHAIQEKIVPTMAIGEKLTAKNILLKPTPTEKAKDLPFKNVIKDIPNIEKLIPKQERLIKINLKFLQDNTIGYKTYIIDHYQIETEDENFNGKIIGFNRKFFQEATSYLNNPTMYMYKSLTAPFMFVHKEYMALVMPVLPQ